MNTYSLTKELSNTRARRHISKDFVKPMEKLFQNYLAEDFRVC